MAGTGAYAIPTDMPFVVKKPVSRTMSEEAKKHFDSLLSLDIQIFEDELTGELYSKVTDTYTGKTEVRKCIYTDED